MSESAQVEIEEVEEEEQDGEKWDEVEETEEESAEPTIVYLYKQGPRYFFAAADSSGSIVKGSESPLFDTAQEAKQVAKATYPALRIR